MKRLSRVDVVFILALAVVLVLAQQLGGWKYLFKLPFMTLLITYYIGKWARNWELSSRRATSGEAGAGKP